MYDFLFMFNSNRGSISLGYQNINNINFPDSMMF